MLTEKLPPPALIWITSVERSLLYTPQVLDSMRKTISTSPIDNYAYLEDMCTALAKGILHTPDDECASGDMVWPQFIETARRPPHIHPLQYKAILRRQAKLLLDGQLAHNIISQFVWIAGCVEWDAITFTKGTDAVEWGPDIKTRFRSIFGDTGFAKSCTYKTSGDFVVHCILKAEHIASWRVCATVRDENVYGAIAAVHGTMSNTIVRQYTDTPPHELLSKHKNTSEGTRFIVTATSVLEITSVKQSRLLIDRDIIRRHNKAVPQLALTNDGPPFKGACSFGYVQGDTFYQFESTMDATLAYVKASHAFGVGDMNDLYYALFDPNQLSSTCLLRQYITE